MLLQTTEGGGRYPASFMLQVYQRVVEDILLYSFMLQVYIAYRDVFNHRGRMTAAQCPAYNMPGRNTHLVFIFSSLQMWKLGSVPQPIM